MKARFLMTMAVAAMTLAACNNEETDTWAGEIRLSSGLEAQQTRSIATDLQGVQIASDVHVGFFINENVASGSTATTTYTQNLDYTASGSGGFNGTAVYYPQSGNGVNIYAYAPWKTSLALNGNYAFSIKADQSKDADYLASDLLWGQPMKEGTNPGEYVTANPVAHTKDAVPVSFKHLLSKIQVELKPDNTSGLTADDFKGAKLEILSVKPEVASPLPMEPLPPLRARLPMYSPPLTPLREPHQPSPPPPSSFHRPSAKARNSCKSPSPPAESSSTHCRTEALTPT